MKRSEKIRLLRQIESREVKLSDLVENFMVIGFYNTDSSQIDEHYIMIDGKMKLVIKSTFDKLKPKMILFDLIMKDA